MCYDMSWFLLFTLKNYNYSFQNYKHLYAFHKTHHNIFYFLNIFFYYLFSSLKRNIKENEEKNCEKNENP